MFCSSHRGFTLLMLGLNLVWSINNVVCQAVADAEEDAKDPLANEELGLTTSQLARLRGFTAVDHNVTTRFGAIISISEISNPLINQSVTGSRRPVLFVHGFVNTGNTWLLNSRGAGPKDYSNICPNANQAQLLDLAQTDLGFNSVPITMLNCGRKVWIVNRRGNTQSRGYASPNLAPYSNPATNIAQTGFGGFSSIGSLLGGLSGFLPTFGALTDPISLFTGSIEQPLNPRYWNYSLDQEALELLDYYDYVLMQENQTKLDLVVHSSGGQITLMALVVQRNFSQKIDHALLYAPSFYLGIGSENALAAPLLPILVSYLGQFPPNFILYPARALIEQVCTPAALRDSICSIVLQLILGADSGMDPVRPGYTEGLLDTTSSHQFAQIIQTSLREKTYFFDYLLPDRNIAAYGQPTPPLYDVAKINSNITMAIFTSNSDGLVPEDGVRDLVRDLQATVNPKLYYINPLDGAIRWDHFSYFFSENLIPLELTIPSVIFVES